MKRALLLFFAVITLAITCSKEEVVYHNRTVPREKVPSFGNTVSMSDVMALLGGSVPLSKTDVGDKYDITPYLGENSDTLMFIVNTKNREGWKIYSSDKRTPAVLAEGEHGYFSIEDGSPAVAVWMDCMAKDIARVRRAKDEELTFSAEEIAANKDFWEAPEPLRGHDDTIPLLPPGHWEEVGVYSSTEEYDHIDHMVGRWDQGDPYNECCPFYVNEPTKRAYTGCVAVAGSQVLRYLHAKIGHPQSMVSDYICIGNIQNPYRVFFNESTSIWSEMDTTYTYPGDSATAVAILMGYVGDLVEMNYCEMFSEQFSWAYPIHLKTYVFDYYGIYCSHGEYNENLVKTNLAAKLPVVVWATNLIVPIDFRIHCFVIDGYRRTRTKYTRHFRYCYDEPLPGPPFPCPPEYSTYTYGPPILSSIKINWGWCTQWQSSPVNDGWYSLTGGWTVINNGNTYDYNYYRNMIYGFSSS